MPLCEGVRMAGNACYTCYPCYRVSATFLNECRVVYRCSMIAKAG